MKNGERVPEVVRDLSRGPGRAVLIVDPSPDHQARLARLMAVHGHRAIGTSTLDGAFAFLEAFSADLVLLAEEVVARAPLAVVAEITARRPNARVVIMVPHGRAELDAEPEPEPESDAEPEPEAQLGERAPVLEYVPRALSGETLATLLP